MTRKPKKPKARKPRETERFKVSPIRNNFEMIIGNHEYILELKTAKEICSWLTKYMAWKESQK